MGCGEGGGVCNPMCGLNGQGVHSKTLLVSFLLCCFAVPPVQKNEEIVARQRECSKPQAAIVRQMVFKVRIFKLYLS